MTELSNPVNKYLQRRKKQLYTHVVGEFHVCASEKGRGEEKGRGKEEVRASPTL
jgi:hypothetical protein